VERVRTELELRRGRSVAGVAGGGEAREGERETNVDERRGAAHFGSSSNRTPLISSSLGYYYAMQNETHDYLPEDHTLDTRRTPSDAPPRFQIRRQSHLDSHRARTCRDDVDPVVRVEEV
jgi:hypothetical protein